MPATFYVQTLLEDDVLAGGSRPCLLLSFFHLGFLYMGRRPRPAPVYPFIETRFPDSYRRSPR